MKKKKIVIPSLLLILVLLTSTKTKAEISVDETKLIDIRDMLLEEIKNRLNSLEKKEDIIQIPVENADPQAIDIDKKHSEDGKNVIKTFDLSDEEIIKQILDNKQHGKKHCLIIVAEGVGGSDALAKKVEQVTGIETRATILGHLQRGGSPTALDRLHASMMGAKAVDLLCEGKAKRVVAYVKGEYVDYDINEALEMMDKESRESIEIMEEDKKFLEDLAKENDVDVEEMMNATVSKQDILPSLLMMTPMAFVGLVLTILLILL